MSCGIYKISLTIKLQDQKIAFHDWEMTSMKKLTSKGTSFQQTQFSWDLMAVGMRNSEHLLITDGKGHRSRQ